jgi:DNA-binding HxlR family transcriptional regulator
MSVTSAESLLITMSIRRAMQADGITRPSLSVREATEVLVEKLRLLDATEAIDVVVISEVPVHVQYVRVKTGELLAEIRMADTSIAGDE